MTMHVYKGTEPYQLVVTLDNVVGIYEKEIFDQVLAKITDKLAEAWIERFGSEVVADINMDTVTNLATATAARKIGGQF